MYAFVEAKESDMIFGVLVKLDPANLQTLLDVHIEGIPRPAEFAPPRLSQEAVLAALTARADALVARDRFSGAILVARHGTVVFEKAWGFANRETKTPVDTGMRFRLGSMNK